MAPEEIEAHLLSMLSGSYLRDSRAGRLNLSVGDSKLDDPIALGLDTNILKQLGRDTILANKLKTALDSPPVSLIIPAQCVIEFWNNYQRFASDDAKKLQTEVNKFKGILSKLGALSLTEGRLEDMRQLAEEITHEVTIATNSNYLDNSSLVMDLLLENALQPMASRVKFNQIALARQSCKIPPGFEDERKGVAGLGDFYAWCDFLMGALATNSSSGTCIFVTDDSKPDWKTGKSGHPELIHEFSRVTGMTLKIVGYAELKIWINQRVEGKVDSSDVEL